MQVTLAGLGCGTAASMTGEAREALLQADLLIGAGRLLESLPEGCTEHRQAATRPGEIWTLLRRSGAQRPCVLYSGDTGFYSGAQGLMPLLREAEIPHRVLPGISSVQMLAAHLGRPWQDWELVSAHGTACSAVSAVSRGRPAFFLTGGELGPAELCAQLVQAGLGQLHVTVGERLSYADERILSGTAEELAGEAFQPLSVLLAEAAPRETFAPGIADDQFIRGKVPMTKQEVRAAILGKLAVRADDTVWDVGAGTGSVSVELALRADRGQVFAVECAPEACELIAQNRERFCAWNLTLVEGRAPEALTHLPPPDAVFIGGTKGCMEEAVDKVLTKNPAARICISAIALETLAAASAALAARGIPAEVTQISVSRSREAGALHLLMATNPVFLITGRGRGGPI